MQWAACVVMLVLMVGETWAEDAELLGPAWRYDPVIIMDTQQNYAGLYDQSLYDRGVSARILAMNCDPQIQNNWGGGFCRGYIMAIFEAYAGIFCYTRKDVIMSEITGAVIAQFPIIGVGTYDEAEDLILEALERAFPCE